MLYTDLSKKALKLCFEAHNEQVDKCGLPYVFHPFHLAEQMATEETVIVALLHDVVEDTPYTLDDIKSMGFSDEITEALKLMTHDESVPYMDYVAQIKNNEIAKAVKLADLKHNSDLSRLDDVDIKAIQRVQKYAEAIKMLTDEACEIENIKFYCYGDKYTSLSGKVVSGCLKLESHIYDKECGSEGYYSLSKQDTVKLFSIMSLNDFIDFCRTNQLIGVVDFFDTDKIKYENITRIFSKRA